MAAGSFIVHLLGHPGVGKRTIGVALAAAAPAGDDRVVLVDNHLTSAALLAIVGSNGIDPLPPEVWTYVREVRRIVYRAIVDLSPSTWSFAFTHVVVEDGSTVAIGEIRALADTRGSTYVPVVLSCDEAEHLRRAVGEDRKVHRKLIDPDAVAAFVAEHRLVIPDDPTLLELDVTALAPSDAAALILDHARAAAR